MLILTAAGRHRGARVKGLDLGPTTTCTSPSPCPSFGGGGVRAPHALQNGRHQRHPSSTPAGVRPGRPRGHHRRQDGGIVRARASGLLEVLLQRAGRPGARSSSSSSKAEWGEEVSNNAIEGRLHPPPACKQKIDGPIRIATVRGLGYRPRKDSRLPLSILIEGKRFCQ